MIELNKRNGAAVEQALIEMYKKIYAQQARIDGLNSAMSSLLEKQVALESRVFELMAKNNGTKATT